jgi:predicted Ser/Thr protein kinase
METFVEIQSKAKRLEALIHLSNNIMEKEKRMPIPFNDFLYLSSKNPELVFRNIYQLFHDMVHHYVPDGKDDFSRDNEHIGFVDYDTSVLLAQDCDDPFFSDRLFANRFMNLINDFRKGSNTNRIYIFEGPPGSGKSTFLNNLLHKFEEYTKKPEGVSYKTYWRLDIEQLGGFQSKEMQKYRIEEEKHKEKKVAANTSILNFPEKYLEFSCPNHDHPILQIPKPFRRQFLEELIPEGEFKQKMFNNREYEWIFKDVPCSICSSIAKTLMDRLGDPLAVFSMINARKNYYNRQLGEGISVFNPGDPLCRENLSKPSLQYMINDLLKNDEVNYSFSYLAKTNNGVLALMDIKEHNVERLKAYHGIISDGVHKVDLTEEYIRTLFIGLVNPEDKIHYVDIKSFQDRIINVNIPYVLDYNTEVAIYTEKFNESILHTFLPGVLSNFAKIIIATRLENDAPALKKWINKPDKYSKYLDKSLLLLKMEIYNGKIPEWLSEDDIKRFNKAMRKEVLAQSEMEGRKGISGRRSLWVFNEFYSLHRNTKRLITMDDVKKYFDNKKDDADVDVPDDFIEKLIDLYDYDVLQQVKESIYFFNKKHISDDIANYLFAINFEIGDTKRNETTGDVIVITEEYLETFEARILGKSSTPTTQKALRRDTFNEYVSDTLSQEIRMEGKKVFDTKLFKALFEKYTRNLKENALAPYAKNENFRRAILDYGTSQFQTYDERLKRDVSYMIENLQSKFGYNEIGARQVSVYVLDKDLPNKY